jgi:hypothetical protein
LRALGRELGELEMDDLTRNLRIVVRASPVPLTVTPIINPPRTRSVGRSATVFFPFYFRRIHAGLPLPSRPVM